MDFSELEDVTISLTKKFIQNLSNLKNMQIDENKFNEISQNCIKHLKISCTKGPSFQNLIVNTNGMLESLREILQNKECKFDADVRLKSFQLLANLCVKNEKSQRRIWKEASELIIHQLRSSEVQFANIAAMITYNIILGIKEDIDFGTVLGVSLDHYNNFLKINSALPDFTPILLEFFVCLYDGIVQLFEQLSPDKQRIFLYYVNDHVENESNE
jgi:hypothetical protein